jgi:hypothetical protein
MKKISNVILAFVGILICLAPPAFGDAIIPKAVPESLSPLWLPVVVAGMFAVSFIRGRKKNN